MTDAAHYLTRADQIARLLKLKIENGEWIERLPPERQLAAQIGVARETLRKALAQLREEGVIEPKAQAGTLITLPDASRQRIGSKRVGILLLMKVTYATNRTLTWMSEVCRLLFQKGVDVEIHEQYRHKRGFFQRLDKVAPCDFWLMFYPTNQAVAWAVKNYPGRSLVAATVKKETGISSVDIHYRALCYHAVGRMIHYGHRHLVLILQHREWGADAESIAGFRQAIEHSGHANVTGEVVYHHGTPESLCALADRLLERKPRPTAWLVAVAPHFLTISMHLQRRGVAVPEEISLVSQDAEAWQHFALPEPTRYEANIQLLAKHTARYVLNGLRCRYRQAQEIRVIPELKPGKTLGPAP